MRLYRFSVFLLLLVMFSACTTTPELPADVTEKISQVRQEFVPDKRIKVFNLEHQFHNGMWEFRFETTEAGAVTAVKNVLDNSFSIDEFTFISRVLPDEALGDSTFGIIRVSVAPIRGKPGHSAEMVDQALMGSVVRVLKAERGWYYIQTGYEYLGWITGEDFVRVDDTTVQKWVSGKRVRVSSPTSTVRTQPVNGAQPVCDAVMDNIFQINGRSGSWASITLPDGRAGFIPAADVEAAPVAGAKKDIERDAVIATAKKLMGVPYLWGGNSPKGVDCSGFTLTVFRANGLQLPRDANMQVNVGSDVIPEPDYSNLLPGDLIFFGPEGRITHVGICLGGSYFIHSSGDVRINSLDPADPLYNDYRKRTFRRIKRVL
jgi:hypothetical protein